MNTREQIAWAAGIFEGEGSCAWTSKERNCQEVSVKQKYPWILYQLAEMFGGKVSPCSGSNALSADLGQRWRLFGANARAFLATIYPLLSPRRKSQVARVDVFDEAELVGIS